VHLPCQCVWESIADHKPAIQIIVNGFARSALLFLPEKLELKQNVRLAEFTYPLSDQETLQLASVAGQNAIATRWLDEGWSRARDRNSSMTIKARHAKGMAL